MSKVFARSGDQSCIHLCLELINATRRARGSQCLRHGGGRAELHPRGGEAGDLTIVLLRHEREWCGGLRKCVAQHGHRSRLWARTTVSLRRMVAIEFGTCRSGRIGGAAGSITGGKVKCFELRGG